MKTGEDGVLGGLGKEKEEGEVEGLSETVQFTSFFWAGLGCYIGSLCSMNIQKSRFLAKCFKDLFSSMFDSFEQEQLEEIAAIVMRLWQRNDLMFKVNFTHPNSMVQYSKQLLLDLKEVQKGVAIIGGDKLRCRWEPSTEGVYKVNCDAAINKSFGKVGIGMVARDCEGKVLATKRCKKSYFLTLIS